MRFRNSFEKPGGAGAEPEDHVNVRLVYP